MEPREESLSVLVATSLILAHPFKFSLCLGRVLTVALQIKNHSLLLSKPSFSFDYIARSASAHQTVRSDP
ncbi:hypothetical protein SE91_08280 [Bradyrhizobium sp. DOA1]|nr:hypothetical protein SE91_08280 [Bradyrhizobium sp. DOA1]